MKQAEAGIEELRSRVDSLIVIPNERLKLVSSEKISFATGFKIADDVLKQAVQSISDLINTTQLINLDFADVSAIMRDAGYAHIGVGHATGKSKAEEASRQAIQSPLLETTINGAKGVIINITGDSDLALEDVELAANMVKGAVHHDANIIFGAAIDEEMDDEIRVIVIATGFDEGAILHEENMFSGSTAAKPAVKTVSADKEDAAEKTASAPPAPDQTDKEEPAEEDPFESIFRIFNKK
jgi:cell division protein FtsZ